MKVSPPTHPPIVEAQPSLAHRKHGREAWNVSPGTGLTALHRSFDLILATTQWEGCHYLYFTNADPEAQRRPVAVQGNLVGKW